MRHSPLVIFSLFLFFQPPFHSVSLVARVSTNSFPPESSKVLAGRNVVHCRRVEFAGSSADRRPRLQHEDHVVQEVVRLAQIALAEIRQFAPDEASQTRRIEDPVDQPDYLCLETVAPYRQVLQRLVIAPLAHLDVGAERQHEGDDQPAAGCQRGSQQPQQRVRTVATVEKIQAEDDVKRTGLLMPSLHVEHPASKIHLPCFYILFVYRNKNFK